MRLGVLSVSVAALRCVRRRGSGAGRRAAARARARVVQSARLAMVRSMRMLQRSVRRAPSMACALQSLRAIKLSSRTRAQPSWPCDKVSWERSWDKTTSCELAKWPVAPAQFLLLVQPAARQSVERPRVLGILHPSTRRDASPALAARREEPSLARQPAHFYAFIEAVSAPRRDTSFCSNTQAHAEEDEHRPRPQERGRAASPR